MQYFETIFLEEVDKFLETLDQQSKKKVIFNIRIAERTNDPKIFKKLNANIWEFRTKYFGQQIRLLAFWDKTDKNRTLVLASNGFVKKTQKTPKGEIVKAERIREQYFREREQNNKKQSK